MAGSHEVSLALFITILFLSTCSGAMMLGAKLVREAGNSKYQISDSGVGKGIDKNEK